MIVVFLAERVLFVPYGNPEEIRVLAQSCCKSGRNSRRVTVSPSTRPRRTEEFNDKDCERVGVAESERRPRRGISHVPRDHACARSPTVLGGARSRPS